MQRTVFFILFLLSIFLFSESNAQQMPLVYDIENNAADCPLPYLPAFDELPNISNLPDPFQWSDGRGRIANYSDWRYRRAEVKAEIEHYEIGEKPLRPDSITASYENDTLRVYITIDGKTLTLTSRVYLPHGDGPFPAVIGMGSRSGSIDTLIFTSRNIAQIPFNFGQVMQHTQVRGKEPINTLYPDLTYIGAYSAWPWGVSRLIDGLELLQDVLPIDLQHLAVTGCSFAGKMALFSGAFDERIALTIAQESGGGGYTTWRVSETLGQVETLGRTSHAWFIEDMFLFSNDVPKLPYDHHELMAMVAPRALLVTGNPDYEWLADESGHVGSKAAKEVWNALGVPDRFGYSIVAGHPHCWIPESQVPEIEAFIDKFLLGDSEANTNIATTPYTTNLSGWITWDTPTLANDSSYFGKTTLLNPAAMETVMDTSAALSWNSVDKAVSYRLQLSTDPGFKTIALADSTTDTLKTISGLQKGKKYYWRVRAKSLNGAGPWSDLRYFITFIDPPGITYPVSAIPYPTRADYVTYTWKSVEFASDYSVQVSKYASFSRYFLSETTADTFITFNGTQEGQTYYWRVRANNVTASGPWSDTTAITIILAPAELGLQSSDPNEISLYWKDNSKVEDGFIIERKQETQSAFTILDSSGSNTTQYTDESVLPGLTYTYRVKAYMDSSASLYSNEASLLITGVQKQQALPGKYALDQNYPNPFNPSTRINFALPKAGHTKLIIYDLLGRKLVTLVNKELPAGYHQFSFDASHLPSAIYFYRLESGDFSQTKKMVLMK